MYNALFMDLFTSSPFVSHSSLLTAKGPNLAFFIATTLTAEVLFKQFVLLYNGLNIVDNEVQWMIPFLDNYNWGAHFMLMHHAWVHQS